MNVNLKFEGSEYWLISIKFDIPEAEFKRSLSQLEDMAEIFTFKLPNFKVGTIDSIVELSDEIGRHDTYVESVVRRLAHLASDVHFDNQEALYETLNVGSLRVDEFIKRFKWDVAKYQIKMPLKMIVESLVNIVSTIETDLKNKYNTFNTIKNALNAETKKNSGSLTSRSLHEIVKKDDFLIGSEFMTTLVVVVPKLLYSNWTSIYPTLASMVVPESSKKIYEDDENGLFTVIVFRKIVSDFKKKARENKFIVREFEYNEEELIIQKKRLAKMITERDKIHSNIIRWLKVNFGEVFAAWMHLKLIRVFVESVLRYGLPATFQCLLLHPKKKYINKVRELLNSNYKKFVPKENGQVDFDNEKRFMADLKKRNNVSEIEKFINADGEYFPYVNFILRTNILE